MIQARFRQRTNSNSQTQLDEMSNSREIEQDFSGLASLSICESLLLALAVALFMMFFLLVDVWITSVVLQSLMSAAAME